MTPPRDAVASVKETLIHALCDEIPPVYQGAWRDRVLTQIAQWIVARDTATWNAALDAALGTLPPGHGYGTRIEKLRRSA